MYRMTRYISRVPEYLAMAAVGDVGAIAMLVVFGVAATALIVKECK